MAFISPSAVAMITKKSQLVTLATERGISLTILPLMKILQRNMKRA
jgi:hypothetical protein